MHAYTKKCFVPSAFPFFLGGGRLAINSVLQSGYCLDEAPAPSDQAINYPRLFGGNWRITWKRKTEPLPVTGHVFEVYPADFDPSCKSTKKNGFLREKQLISTFSDTDLITRVRTDWVKNEKNFTKALLARAIQEITSQIYLSWVGFYGTSTIVGYLMPNPLYTYILDIYDLVSLGFMAYQPLWVI